MFSLFEMLGRKAPLLRIVDVVRHVDRSRRLGISIAAQGGLFDVVGFEPVQSECDRLNALKRDGHRYLPHFVGDGSERTFHLCNFPETSSLYEPEPRVISLFQILPEVMKVLERTQVQTRRLDDIPEVSGMDLLKIDVQGAEVDCFRGAPRLLREAVVVQTEVCFIPQYRNQPLFAEVDQELRRQGFLLHTFTPIQSRCFRPFMAGNDPARGLHQALWADAVYVKDFSRFGELSAEQSLKLAVILHEMIGSFDLAALAIRHHDAKSGAGLWPIYMKRLTGSVPELPPLA